jgi:hypothetical protein
MPRPLTFPNSLHWVSVPCASGWSL